VTGDPDRPAGKQTRRRGRALEQAILDAAWQELRERGWAGFTIDGVAARSGAAKSVIYRRWHGRVDLALHLLQRSSESLEESFESSGTLRDDLLSFLRGMAQFLRSPFGDAVRGVTAEGDPRRQPSLFGDTAIVALVAEIADRAVARGELAATPPALALNLGHGLVMSEFLHTHAPPSDPGLAQFVDTIWLPALVRTASQELASGGPGAEAG
jgi:AcrR family transcriptional regulator